MHDDDLWALGSTISGVDAVYLRIYYPHIQYPFDMTDKIYKILLDHFPPRPDGQESYQRIGDEVFFQTREDADLFRGLLYLY